MISVAMLGNCMLVNLQLAGWSTHFKAGQRQCGLREYCIATARIGQYICSVFNLTWFITCAFVLYQKGSTAWNPFPGHFTFVQERRLSSRGEVLVSAR